MEPLKIATNVPGILASAGQAIEGIVQLRAFFKDISLAPRRTGELLKDMESLIDTLADIQQLLTTLDRSSSEELDARATFNTSILKWNLKSCAEDIAIWVKVTKGADPRSEKGLKAFFKKVKIAVDKSGFEELGNKISSHRQRIGISLSILGRQVVAFIRDRLWSDLLSRSLDYTGIERLDELSSKFNGLTEAHLKLNDTINMQHAAGTSEGFGHQLQNLEAFMENQLERLNLNHSESQQSIQSLSSSMSSLASHISKLLEKTADTNNDQGINSPGIIDTGVLPHDEWCCDALSGIDDAFNESDKGYDCVYCSSQFIALSPNQDLSFQRGRHIAEVHAFGGCNLAVTYQSWKELELHLRSFHNLGTEEGRVIDQFHRDKRPLPLFRGDTHFDGQPMSSVERPTEVLIMMARLKLALEQVHLLRETPKVMDYFLPAWQKDIALGVAFPPERLFALRYEIVCIVEELIISGNDRNDDAMDFVKSHPELFAGKKTRIQDKEVFRTINGSTRRNMINDWFLCTLKQSRTLRFFLACGRIAPELPPALSPDWILPILEFWDSDEVATGFKQPYQASDGAIDSRDDLKADIDSKYPDAVKGNNQETKAGFPAKSDFSPAETGLTNFDTTGSLEAAAKIQANSRQRSVLYDLGNKYSCFVTKSRSGSAYSGSSFGSV